MRLPLLRKRMFIDHDAVGVRWDGSGRSMHGPDRGGFRPSVVGGYGGPNVGTDIPVTEGGIVCA